MAEEKKKELWTVQRVRLVEGAPARDPRHQSQVQPIFNSDPKSLRIEFDPVLRAVYLTALKPDVEGVKVKGYIPDPAKRVITVPFENVASLE